MTVYFICGLAGHVMTGLGKIMVAQHEQATANRIVAASGGMLNEDMAKIIVNPDYFDKSVNYGDVLNFMLFYIIMGYLVWKIPNLVSAMVSGSPQMDAGSVLRSAIGGAGMVAAGVAGAAHVAGNVAGTWAATGASGSGGAAGGAGAGGNSAVQAATSVSPGTPGTPGGILLSPDGPTIQANGMNVNSKDISNQGNFDLASRVAADTTGGAGGDSDSSTSESAASSRDGKSNPRNESEKPAKQAEEGTGATATTASVAAPAAAKAAPSQAKSAPPSSWARRAAPSSPEERARSSHLGRFARAMVLQGLAGSGLVKHFQHGLQESAYNAGVADQIHNNLHEYLTNPQGYRFHDDGGDV